MGDYACEEEKEEDCYPIFISFNLFRYECLLMTTRDQFKNLFCEIVFWLVAVRYIRSALRGNE